MNKKNTKSKTINGLIWDIGGAFIKQVITFAISIILARLLSPTEFGIIGMALVFVGISEVFIDVGFTDGIIQQKVVNSITLSSIFYLNVAISFVLSFIIFISSNLISDFYELDVVGEIIKYLSVIPILAALGKVHSAILIRKMNFKALTIRLITSNLIGGIIGVVLAFMGYGVYSLIWQQIIATLTSTVLLWIGTKWKPKFEFSWKEVKGIFNFSSFTCYDELLRQIFNRINTLFV